MPEHKLCSSDLKTEIAWKDKNLRTGDTINNRSDSIFLYLWRPGNYFSQYHSLSILNLSLSQYQNIYISMSTDEMSFRTHSVSVKYEHFASLTQTRYHSMNNHSNKTYWTIVPWMKLQSAIHILIQAHYLLVESKKKGKLQGLQS